MNTSSLQLSISERRVILRIGDTLAVVIASLLSLRLWSLVDGTAFRTDFVLDNIYWIPLLVLLWVILASANDFYNLRISGSLSESVVRLSLITLQLLFVYLLIFFLSPPRTLPRLFILYYGVFSFFLIVTWRLVIWALLIRQLNVKRRVIIVGAGWAARTIVAALKEEASSDYEIIGLISNFDPEDTLTEEIRVLGGGEQLVPSVEKYAVSEIVLAFGAQLPGNIFQGVLDSYERGISIVPMPLLYERITGRVPIEHVDINDWHVVLPIEATSIFDPYLPIKRIMDIAISLVGLVLFSLMLPFIAIAIRLDSKGPIFFIQERIGRAGKAFKMIKLRTMVQDAEKAGPQWSTERDPRITRVGNFLRKSRLDELPQFINILRGDMSLVGPRAERPHFVDQLAEDIPFYRARLVVRPGATGWAQIRYGYGRTTNDALIKLQYDLYYIRHQSLLLDALIIFRTLGTIIRLSGA